MRRIPLLTLHSTNQNVLGGMFQVDEFDDLCGVAADFENQRPQGQATTDPDPQKELELVLDAALAHAGVHLENMRFELALRGLGRRDAKVATMLIEVDQLRLRLFAGKFLRLTGKQRSATDLAALFYLAIIGSNQALSRPANPPQTKDYLRGVITRYLIRDHAAR